MLRMNPKWITCLILSMCVQIVQGLSVHFKNPEATYVGLGRVLVLEAFIKKIPGETVLMVTWERNNQAGARRLATFPGKTQDPRISMERNGTTLRISDVQGSDFGLYTITATDQHGTQTFVEKYVSENVKPPEVSVVLLCDVSRERAQWDSPVFTWLVDGEEMTNQTATLSTDGSKLHLQGIKGYNYTCISNSSLGTSVAHFIIPGSTECPKWRSWCIVLIVFLIIFIIVLAGRYLFLQKKSPCYTPTSSRDGQL